jgi:hypothetical protein
MAASASQRLDELLLLRATEGLDAADERELERLLAEERGVDAGGYERAAAAVCLAVLGGGGAMPPALRARLERQARTLGEPSGEGS